LADETVFTRIQRPGEKMRDYVAQMQKLASRMPWLTDDLLLWTILIGLRPQMKAGVIKQKNDIKSLADLSQLAKLAESAGLGSEDDRDGDSKVAEPMDVVKAGREEVQQLTAHMVGMSVSVTQRRSPTPERRLSRVASREPNTTPGGHQVGGPLTYNRQARILRKQSCFHKGDTGRQFSRPGAGMPSGPCVRCDRYHTYKRCPAMNATCCSCGRVGHFRAKCRGAKRDAMNLSE